MKLEKKIKLEKKHLFQETSAIVVSTRPQICLGGEVEEEGEEETATATAGTLNDSGALARARPPAAPGARLRETTPDEGAPSENGGGSETVAIQTERSEVPSGTRKGASAETEAAGLPLTTKSDGESERGAEEVEAEAEAAEETAAPSQTTATLALPPAATTTGSVRSLEAAAGCDICSE